MKLARLLPLLLIAAMSAFAQEGTPKELLQGLFAGGSTPEQFEEAVKAANKGGVPRQQIIEAKLVWGLRNQDHAYLLKILPELEVLAANFDPATSAGLKSGDEVRGFISYVKALDAEAKADDKAFKTHILEALWTSPQQGPMFLQAIEKHRRAAKMAGMKLDLAQVLTTSGGEATTLADQLAGKKALLIDFWATWCGPCMQLMPELKKKADKLASHGIVVAGMNKDEQNAESAAERVRNDLDINFPWLIEPAERPFTKLLEIDSIPRMVLVAPDGSVLYNGHPQDPALWGALKKIDPAIQIPES